MKKLTESEKRIVRQEFRRAFIIREAKKQLNKADFGFFMHEMTDYENNMVLKESNQEFLYEGLWDRMKNMVGGMLKKAPPDQQEKLKDLTNQLDFVITGDLAAATETGDKGGIVAANSKAQDLLKQIGAIDPQAAKAAAEAYKIEAAEETGGGGGAGGAGGDPPAEPTGNVKQDAQAQVGGMENPKAKGILGSIFDSYKFAFAANASMWEKIYGWISNIGNKPPQQQAQDMEKVKKQVDDKLETDEEAGRTGDEEDGEGEKKPIRVRNIQRPIVSIIQKVLSSQGVDIKLADAQKLAIQITKNLVDQMKANDVLFKEALANEITKVLKEERLVFTSRAKLTNKMIKQHNTSNPKAFNQVEEFPEDPGAKIGQGKGGIYNYKLAKKDPKVWMALSKDWIITRMQKGYGTIKDLSAAMENDDNFLDVWDIFKDLMTIKKMYLPVKNIAKKNDPDLVEPMALMFKKLKNQSRVFQRAQGVGWNWAGGAEWKEASKRALELKKAGKGRGDKKEDPKDLSVGAPVKGQINISKVVGKAIQSHGGLDAETASKLTPIIKKKIEKVIMKHLKHQVGMGKYGADDEAVKSGEKKAGDEKDKLDIKIVEQKVGRYVRTILEELDKRGM